MQEQMFAGVYTSGLSAAIAPQLILSFGLGWWLRGQSGTTKVAIPPDVAARALISRLDKLSADQGAVMGRIADELIALAANTHKAARKPLHDVAAQLGTANAELVAAVESMRKLAQQRPSSGHVLTGDELSARLNSFAAPDKAAPQGQVFRHSSAQIGDRHRSDRKAYPFVQLVAPYTENVNSAKFQRVQFNDLSGTGFSYWSDKRPVCHRLLVQFANAGEPLLLSRKIVDVTLESNNGTDQFLVDCRFQGHTEHKLVAG